MNSSNTLSNFAHPSPTPLVIADRLVKIFPNRVIKEGVRALDRVSVEIEPGQTLALVGESGSGKTTLGRCVVGLTQPTEGTIRIAGNDVYAKDKAARRAARQSVQMVFQDPNESLDPTMNVAQIVCEPIVIRERIRPREVMRRAGELLDDVGLGARFLRRRPFELSGGEKQRVAIARAISTNPAFIVLDEPTSAVDFALRRHILSLLRGIQSAHALTYLFITHDLISARYMARQTVVMYAGRVVETGPTVDVLRAPKHPYTRILVDSALSARPGSRPTIARSELIANEVRNWIGCAFRQLCPLATERCTQETPELRLVASDHSTACHYAEQVVRPDRRDME